MKTLETKKKVNPRYFVALIMIIVAGALIYAASETGIIGKIIALILVCAAGAVAIFETIWVCLSKNKLYVAMAILSMLVVIASDYKFLKQVISATSAFKIDYFMRRIFSWWILIIPFFFILPFLFFKQKETIDNVFFIILITIIFTFVVKIFFTLAVFKWTYVTYVLGIAIIFDSTAYFFGSIFGTKLIKHRLAPTLSPKKSWEGFISGWICASIFAGLFGYYENIFSYNFPIFTISHFQVEVLSAIFVGVLLPPICQAGDLFFSAIKRSHEVKDFSNIFPGHGGMADRIDGLAFVCIAFAFLMGIAITASQVTQ